MTVRFRHFLALFSAGIAVIIIFLMYIYARYPFFVENFYSRWIYVSLSHILRSSIGSLPIVVGDFCFLIFALVLAYVAYQACILIWTRKYKRVFNTRVGLLVFIIFAYNYIIFNVFWGLNYKRIPLDEQYDFEKPLTYGRQDIEVLADFLVNKLNNLEPDIRSSRAKLQNFTIARKMVVDAIETLKFEGRIRKTEDSILFLNYEYPSIKRSVLSFALAKMGIAGYHHPFTGEAIVNVRSPKILLPAVILHEIAHQLGYPKEEEAELLVYIIGDYVHNPLLAYSIYLDVFISLALEMQRAYPDLYAKYNKGLHANIQQDLRDFMAYLEHNNARTPYLKTQFYVTFFALNSNIQGVEAKSKALELVIAYNKMRAKMQHNCEKQVAKLRKNQAHKIKYSLPN